METIIKENTRYTILVFDKYILCDIKDYCLSDIMFAPVDKLGRHKIKSYISENVLMNEVGHHLYQWFLHLDEMNKRYGNRAQEWWNEIKKLNQKVIEGGFDKGLRSFYSFDHLALEYCIKQNYIKIVKLQERIVLEV